MEQRDFVQAARAMIHLDENADVARRYLSLGKRKAILKRAEISRRPKATEFLKRVLEERKQLRKELKKALRRFCGMRFRAVVDLDDLRVAILNSKGDNLVLGVGNGLRLNGQLVPSIETKGRGLAAISAHDLSSSLSGAGAKVALLEFHRSFWIVGLGGMNGDEKWSSDPVAHEYRSAE